MMTEHATLRGWAEGFLGQYSADCKLYLRFDDCTIYVQSNSKRLIEELTDYYGGFVAKESADPGIHVYLLEAPEQSIDLPFTAYPPGPGKTRIKDEYVDFPDGRLLRKRLTRMVFLFGGEHNIAVGPCLENSNQAVNFINNRFIQSVLDRGYLLCHAAAVARQGRGIALAGFSGRGKSTLGLHIMGQGLDFVSNDRLMIKRHTGKVRMLGLAKLPRINPGTILNNPRLGVLITEEERLHFEQLSSEELWELEQKYDADVEECFGPGRISLASNMVGAMILNWNREGGPAQFSKVELRDRRDLLEALMKRPGVHYYSGPGKTETDIPEAHYLELLEGVPVMEASGGVDFEAAKAVCLDMLGVGDIDSVAIESREI
ncbi:MAG: HprK-related kinase B [Phycisphaerales bacterium]|nr:HprK-related kinase B [Phycisphaerales bacterium]